MGATRDVALNELPMRGISINADASGVNAFTLIPSDSGIIFINNEDATSATTYTLPEVADCEGKWFWFYNGQTTQTIVITAPTASEGTMVCKGQAAYDSMTSDAVIGSFGLVFGDGDFYYFVDAKGSWTAGT